MTKQKGITSSAGEEIIDMDTDRLISWLLVFGLTLLIFPTCLYANSDDYDAESGTTDRWSVLDNEPGGAIINNWFDQTLNSNVIEFTGTEDGTQNSYLFGTAKGSGGWQNQQNFVVSWKMLFHDSFALTFWVNTSNGIRSLQYSPSKIESSTPDTTIHVKLSAQKTIGKWITLERDVAKDLQRAEPTNRLLSMHGLVVRGSGRLDDILFRPNAKPETTTSTSTPEPDTLAINKTAIVSEDNPSIDGSLSKGQLGTLSSGLGIPLARGKPIDNIRNFSDVAIEWVTSGQENQLSFSFHARGLDDYLSGRVRHYLWDFGDGTPSIITSSPDVIYSYQAPGRYTVTLTLKNSADVSVVTANAVVTAESENTPSIRIIRPGTLHQSMAAPVIDGIIREDAWNSAAHIPSLTRYPEVRPPNDRTEVRILMDADRLYVAFKSYTADPDSISAIQTIRDYALGSDDRVTLELETYATSRLTSTFNVNALGTQNDIIMGGRASKIEWKGDWLASAVKTDYGWSAEMAIPFHILNFDPTATEFGVNFWRYQNSAQEWSSWVGDADDPTESRSGKLVGLTLGSFTRSKNWTAMPYVLGSINGADNDGDSKDWLINSGVTVRYEPKPNVTVVADVLPDFTQLETQFDSINFSYTENYVAEVRPFFQEGSAYFATNGHYFYSPRIPNFYGGVKSYAQFNKSSMSGFFTTSPDNRSDGMVRYKKEFIEDHEVELVGVGTDQGEFQNLVFGSNVLGSWDSGFYYNLSYSLSDTKWVDNISGPYAQLILGRSFGDFDVGINGSYYDTGYQPANGLVANNLPGTQGGALYFSHSPGKINDTVTAFQTSAGIESRETFDGNLQNENAYLNSSLSLNNWFTLSGAYFVSNYRPNIGSPGLFSEVVNNDQTFSVGMDFNIDSSVYGYGFSLIDGTLGGGDYRFLSTYTWLKPTPSLYLSASFADLESFGNRTQLTLDVNFDITHEDSVNAQYYREEGFEYTRLLYRRVVRSGFDIFGVFENSTYDEQKLSAKLVWTI